MHFVFRMTWIETPALEFINCLILSKPIIFSDPNIVFLKMRIIIPIL